MKKNILLLAVPFVLLAANEPSAYSAGDLDSPTPYGLTSSEKHILKNKQEVKTLEKKVGGVSVQLSQINENYEGLRSVTEAIGAKIAKIDAKILELDTKVDENNASIQEEIQTLKSYVEESRTLQEKNQENIKIVLSEMSSLIDSINNNYVSKKELATLEEKIASLEKQATQTNQKSSDFANMSGAELLESAVKDFEQKFYENAKAKFKELIDKNYKPARSNFYLAEIYYAQKSYTQAIAHYKQSISLYDKASYMPQLLYHTGISFSKLNKPEEAKKFFEALKNGYPQSKEALSLQK
jgi:TolA-binding protein